MMATDTFSRETRQKHTLVASDRVEDTAVRRLDGEKIGTVQRLMIDKVSGKVAYAVLRFGGFFGFGEKHLPLSWEKLKYDPAMESYVVQIGDEELARAPSYAVDKEFDWGDRSEEKRLHDYYGTKPYSGI